MWNKKEDAPNPSPPPTSSQKPAESPKPRNNRPAATGPAVIGPSITVKGDLSGEEDLLIEGRVEGEVKLSQHSVTIGRSGRVQADVFGQSIRVEGEVHGNLTGDNEVVIRNTGRVEGNIVAPRVTLEDGSSFRGAIDMQTPQQSQRKQAESRAAQSSSQSGSKASGSNTSGSSASGSGASGSNAGSNASDSAQKAKPKPSSAEAPA